MAYNNVNQESGLRVPAGAQSVSQTAANDFQAGQPMSEKPFAKDRALSHSLHIGIDECTAEEVSSADSKRTQQPSSSKVEERLEREGHLPGLGEVQNDNEKNLRQPGQDDAAGNKIHHKGILGKMLHWEHNGMNAD
ncbi:MAG: hypothetical protein Q9225_002520 [Loekoesia sp. 1 TL-2023]